MKKITRRQFLTSAGATSAALLLSSLPHAAAADENCLRRVAPAAANSNDLSWDMAEEILTHISDPVFPAYTVNVLAYGAVPNDGKLDTAELDTEMETLRKQLRQLTGTKDRLGEQIDALDFDDPHYTRKAQDLQERQNRVYDQIASIEGSIAEVQTRMDNIRQRRISTDNVYQFLLYFDKLYDQFTDLEKKTFMNSFIERVEIYPERQSDGRIIKRIEFRFPVYFNGSKIAGLGWDETDMSETVCVLSKLQEGKTYRD